MVTTDVVVIGAGHNGLVAALFLARSGLRVSVLEDKPVIGGAVRTEFPFSKAPKLGASTGASLLGLMPPELIERMGIELPLRRRDPHYFLPTTGARYVLLGSDGAEMQRQLTEFFSDADSRAYFAMQTEIAQIRDDIAPTWLAEPLTIEATAERYVRAPLRQVFVDLCRKSADDYLARFDFKSDLVKTMVAAGDAFPGRNGKWDTPGTGMNLLVQNMRRLPSADGTWMVVLGGMGTVTRRIAAAALKSGATIETGKQVVQILVDGNAAKGVLLADGTEIHATTIVCNADPFRMRGLIGEARLPAEYNQRLDAYARDGATLKVNLALRELPKFRCLPEDKGQHAATIHLLPDEKDVTTTLADGFLDVIAGKLPEFPPIEWTFHTPVDVPLRSATGHHDSALYVRCVPYDLVGTSWAAQEERYVSHLLSICDRFAPGTSDLVVDTFPLHPKKVESYFGITRGHIHHIDNAFGFSDRLPYPTPISGVYSCSAGCHPAGSVIGAAGHNAARRVLRDMEIRLEQTDIGHKPGA